MSCDTDLSQHLKPYGHQDTGNMLAAGLAPYALYTATRQDIRVCDPCWDDMCEMCRRGPCCCACQDAWFFPVTAEEAERNRAVLDAELRAAAKKRRTA